MFQAFVGEYHTSKSDFVVMVITFVTTLMLNTELGLAVGVASSIPVFCFSTYGRAMIFSLYAKPYFVDGLTINLDAVVINVDTFLSLSGFARHRLPEYLVTCRGIEARDRQLWIVVNGTKFWRPLTKQDCANLWSLVRDVQKLKLVYDEEQATVLFVGLCWPEDEYRTPLIAEGLVRCNNLDEVLERARALDCEKPCGYCPGQSFGGAEKAYTFLPLRVPTVEDAQIQDSTPLLSP